MIKSATDLFKNINITHSSFVDILHTRAELTPDKEVFTFIKSEGNVTLTYSELDRRIRRLASHLQSLNLTGERALLLYPPGLEYIIGYFACLYSGVIAVPVYPPDPAKIKKSLPRLEAISKDSKAKIALSTNSIVKDIEIWRKIIIGIPTEHNLNDNQFNELNNNSHKFDDILNIQWIAADTINYEIEDNWVYPKIDSSDIAYLQYTSGSTGIPKGVIISHGNLIHNANMIYSGFGLSENEHEGVIWLPIYHDMGLVGGILEPIFAGFHSNLFSPIDFLKRPLRWLQFISDLSNEKNVVSGGPNFAYDLCVRATNPQKSERLDLSNWSIAFSGAEPVRAETIDSFSNTFKISNFRKEAFYPCYGLAEGTLIVSGGKNSEKPILFKADKEEIKKGKINEVADELPNGINFISSGRALLDGEINIVDPVTKEECEDLTVGEVWASSKSNALGYWKNKELSESTFNAFISGNNKGPYLRTGDLGFIKNNELYISGRLKDLIIIRGSNHYPQDIEATVEKSSNLLRPSSNAAFSIEYNNEEQLVVVQEARNKKGINWDDVVSEIKIAISQVHNIQAHAIILIEPKTIFKTSSGKIQRSATKYAYSNNELEIIYQWNQIEENTNKSNIVISEISSSRSLENDVINSSDLILWLRQKISKELNIGFTKIDVNKPFVEFGLDSAKSVGLVGDLEEKLNVDLDPTILWSYPTITRLVEFLTNDKKDKIDVEELKSISEYSKEIEDLSEEEAELLLMEKLGLNKKKE